MADFLCRADRMVCFVGCYTDDAHPEGIHVIDVDLEFGALRRISTVRLPNAIYQAQSPCGRYLISCMRGGLAAFRIKDDALVPTDRVEWGGQCLCHVSVMPDGNRVCWADYLAGEAGSIGFDEGRFVSGSMIRHRHEGCGPNLPRQASAHCHQAIPLPGGRVALTALERSGKLVSLRGDSDAGSFSEIAVLGGFYRPSSVSILSRPR